MKGRLPSHEFLSRERAALAANRYHPDTALAARILSTGVSLVSDISYRPTGSLPSDPLGAYTGPWNRRLAAHLMRRAGFGGTPAQVDLLAGVSMEKAVDGLVHFPPTPNLTDGPANLPKVYGANGQSLLAPGIDMMTRRRARAPQVNEIDTLPRPEAAMANGAPTPAETPVSGVDNALLARRKALNMARRQAYVAITEWWMGRMLTTPAPLQEKMTLFFHGHFTSADQKGITAQQLLNQNNLFRKNALGNFGDLTLKVAADPAMLRYLDNATNVAEHPNENFARELMELFTLGHGNYTEQDVREGARAFTGWTLTRPYIVGEFTFDPAKHDGGRKTFLGKSGNFNGTDIVNIIFNTDAAPRFIATKLLEFFLYDDPEPQLVDAFAAEIRGHRYELAPAMSTLFRSNVFYSNRAYRALVKSPCEFVIGSMQLFGMTQAPQATIGAMTRMGQRLFYPPNVKGWDGGAAWLNSQTMLTRENFASGLMKTPTAIDAPFIPPGGPTIGAKAIADHLVAALVQGDASAASYQRLVAYLDGAGVSADAGLSGENYDERVRGAAYLTMAMPAYQLS
jgi:uncharacterized protein (DUF1800 family)